MRELSEVRTSEVSQERQTLKMLSERLVKAPDGLSPQRASEALADRLERRPSELEKIETELKKCNPNHDKGNQWQVNCQRCVPTYEMRRRGLDVTALPRLDPKDRGDLAFDPFDVWKSPEVLKCDGNGLKDIEAQMGKWGDGARAEVIVKWKNTNMGHAFVAEQVDGRTVFIDPIDGSTNARSYFDSVEPGSVRLCRMDKLQVTKRIDECCREV